MRTSTAFEAELLDIVDASLAHAGYYVVQLRLAEGQRKRGGKSLQLTAERLDGMPMSVKDCEVITDTASALLDVKDPIDSEYDLEVSSPGLERPLVKLQDFEAYKGFKAQVDLNISQNGRKRFRGEIIEVNGADVVISVGRDQFSLPFASMKAARLIATEEMIRQLLKESEKQVPEASQEATENTN